MQIYGLTELFNEDYETVMIGKNTISSTRMTGHTGTHRCCRRKELAFGYVGITTTSKRICINTFTGIISWQQLKAILSGRILVLSN